MTAYRKEGDVKAVLLAALGRAVAVAVAVAPAPATEVVLPAVNAGETRATKRDPSEYPDYYEQLRTLLRRLGYDDGRGPRLGSSSRAAQRVWCSMTTDSSVCDAASRRDDPMRVGS
jgi:hypothetical protein